jgi:TatD DNase family protein
VSSTLAPLDVHAHVETSIAPEDLRALRAVVVAVTRDPREWDDALARTDPTTLWGIGVHPGVAAAIDEFDDRRFPAALERAVFVGEVGLDGRARTDRDRQREVFESVLAALVEQPRPVTIHSTAASREVLDALRARPVAAPILHWWRGTREQTRAAVDLGCFFSINAHEVIRPRVLDLVPAERLLTETDYPHTRRYDRTAVRPGVVTVVEAHLEERWDVDRFEVRRRLWCNLGAVLSQTAVIDRMPRAILAGLATAGFEG